MEHMVRSTIQGVNSAFGNDHSQGRTIFMDVPKDVRKTSGGTSKASPLGLFEVGRSCHNLYIALVVKNAGNQKIW